MRPSHLSPSLQFPTNLAALTFSITLSSVRHFFLCHAAFCHAAPQYEACLQHEQRFSKKTFLPQWEHFAYPDDIAVSFGLGLVAAGSTSLAQTPGSRTLSPPV